MKISWSTQKLITTTNIKETITQNTSNQGANYCREVLWRKSSLTHFSASSWVLYFIKYFASPTCYILWPSKILNYGSLFSPWFRSVMMEKAMAPHFSTLAWKIPWTEEPGGLQSMGSLGVGHDWATSLSLFTLMHWRRKWQPTPVFFPGESQQGSLVGCHLWDRTESDTTEVTSQ